MTKEKCNEKCDIYSRITGYFRPLNNWNIGKLEEFKDRKMYTSKSLSINKHRKIKVLPPELRK